MTIKTFKRINPIAKNFTDFPSPTQVTKDLFNGDIYELIDYVDKCVTFAFDINKFCISVCMDITDAGYYRDVFKTALENKNYYWLISFVYDYVNTYGDTFCCAIHQCCKENGKKKVIHYETVEEIKEALHLIISEGVK